MTPARKAKIEKSLRNRIHNIGFAFEDPTDPHNVAAAVRSLEALGIWNIQELRNNQASYAQLNGRVAIGARKWVNYTQTPIDQFLEKPGTTGFDSSPNLWVSHIPKDGRTHKSIEDWSPDLGPTIFVFGNEHAGVSDTMIERADQLFSIPMYGMVESYNLSVSASLCAWHIRSSINALESAMPWHLNEEDIQNYLQNFQNG